MIRKERNGITWLEFEQLQSYPFLQHGVFLRHGGVSQGEYSSLNTSYITGDRQESVDENLRRIQEAMGVTQLVSGEQCHGNRVLEVEQVESWNNPQCDAIMTQQTAIALLTRHADCQPAIFYVPRLQVIANVHCGWKGNVVNIYQATVDTLCNRYGCNPEDILVCIGPSLGPDAAEFTNYKEELPESFWKYDNGTNHFDLWGITKQQLRDAGVLSSNIEVARICTKSNPEDFFSYRRCRESGRHATVVMMKG